jgi:tetratricopeptide (TPR) repeat protein
MARLIAAARRLAASRVAPLAVAALAFVVYAGTLRHGFVYDDGRQIVDNPWIWNPGEWINLLAKPVWAFLDENATNFYRPVQTLVHFTAARISGHDPFAFHLLAVLMHALASATAFLMLRRVTGPARALAAAALFAVHPIHAEAVAWVSAGPDVNAAAFLFLALALASRALESSRPAPPGFAAGGAALVACFAKETAMVAPILAALQPGPAPGPARPPGVARRRRVLVMAVAFVAPVAIYLAARAGALGGLAPGGVRAGMDAAAAAGTALALVPRYVALAFVPWRMVPDRFVVPVAGPLAPAALLGVATLVAAIAAWVALRRRAPALAWGLALLFVPLAPALMVAWFASTPQADRYLYIPSIGACLIVAEVLGWLARRGRTAVGAAPAAVLCVLLVAVGAAGAAGAAAIWRDSGTLGRAGIALEPRSIAMRLELIHALDASGRLEEALGEARAAAALAPGDRRAAAAIANLEARAALRNGGDAVAIYQAAVEADPAQAHLWVGLSAALLSTGRPAEAIEAAERALAIDRFNRAALVNLGTARGESGDIEGQEREAHRLLAIDAGSAAGWLNLGAALLRRGDLDGAAAALGRAAALDPSSARAELYLSWLAAKRGDRGEALDRARRATTLDPGDAEAWNRLGVELAAAGDRDGARAAWEKAIAARPDHPGANENLKRLRATGGSAPP